MSEAWKDARKAHRLGARERIIGAALELVAERGMAAVTMSKLAERAGVSRPTLYAHFPDLEHAVEAWLADEVAGVQAVLAERLAAHEDPLERLGAYVRVQCEYFAGAEHAFSAARLDPLQRGSGMAAVIQEHVQKFEAEVQGMLNQAVALGLVRADLDTGLHAELVVALVGSTMARLTEGTLSPREATTVILRLLRQGLSA